MAETWNKKEREKKREQNKKQKAERKQERKEKAKESKGFDDMLAYIDENGNISNTPPDPRKKEVIDAADIEIGVPKMEDRIKAETHKGVITFYNTAKGFGFIKDRNTQQSIFFHSNGLLEPVKEQDKVGFDLEKTPKGLAAVNVKLLR
jgi:cold shock CspA family protein